MVSVSLSRAKFLLQCLYLLLPVCGVHFYFNFSYQSSFIIISSNNRSGILFIIASHNILIQLAFTHMTSVDQPEC